MLSRCPPKYSKISQVTPLKRGPEDDLEVSGGRGWVPGWGEVGARRRGKEKEEPMVEGGGLCAAKPANEKSVTN